MGPEAKKIGSKIEWEGGSYSRCPNRRSVVVAHEAFNLRAAGSTPAVGIFFASGLVGPMTLSPFARLFDLLSFCAPFRPLCLFARLFDPFVFFVFLRAFF